MMLVIAVILNVVLTVLSQKPQLHLCNKPEKGMDCMFMCKLTDNTEAPVTIYKEDVEIASCKDSSSCVVNSTFHSDSMISWDSHDNVTMIHFTIKNLEISNDQGKWKCSHGTEFSAEQTLTVYSKPSSCNLVKEGEVNATLKCHVTCAYPEDQVHVKLYEDNKEVTEMATKTPADSSNCEVAEEKSVTYEWPIIYNSGSMYKCECAVTALDWTETDMLDTNEKDQDGGPQTTTIVAIVIVVVFVVLAVIVAIILIQKRRNAKGGAQLAKEAEGEREEL